MQSQDHQAASLPMEVAGQGRRKLTILNHDMQRRKNAILISLRKRLAGKFLAILSYLLLFDSMLNLLDGHTLVIQRIPSGNTNAPRTTCAYDFCASRSCEIIPGTYRVSLEPHRYADVVSKAIPYQPEANYETLSTKPSGPGSLHGKAAKRNVVWYCLRCFEKIWRCQDKDLATSQALQDDDYVPLARVRRSMIVEDRSERTEVDVDLDLAPLHEIAFYRWCGFHTDIEVRAGEKPVLLVRGPEGEFMDESDSRSLNAAYINGPAYSAKIDLDFVRGKALSRIFSELDTVVIPIEEAKLEAIKKEEAAKLKAIEAVNARQKADALRFKKHKDEGE